jgi:hypothetical protein
MVDLREQTQKYEVWWRKENDRPLVNSYYPQKLPFGGLDVNVPLDRLLERKLANAEVLHRSPCPQDTLIVQRVNYGTALYPSVAGAEARFEDGTSWGVHTCERAEEIEITPFDPAHPVYRTYLQKLELLLENWSWDTYLPVPSDYAGTFDILSAFMGPENLMVEMMSESDDVARAADAAADFMIDVIRFEKGLFRSAGFREWSPTLFASWQPGWSGLFSEDFSALVGPDHYREHILPYDRRVLAEFDSALFHTHSAGYKNNLEMLALPKTVAFEFGNDPGGPDTDTRIETVQAMLDDGRSVMMGSWSIPLSDDDINRIANALPSQGMDYHFQCNSAEEAAELYGRLKAGAPVRPVAR